MKKRIFLTSVEELVKVITKLDSQLLAKKKDKEKQGIVFDTQPIILFRGEEDVSFKLLPSIFRTEKLKKMKTDSLINYSPPMLMSLRKIGILLIN